MNLEDRRFIFCLKEGQCLLAIRGKFVRTLSLQRSSIESDEVELLLCFLLVSAATICQKFLNNIANCVMGLVTSHYSAAFCSNLFVFTLFG